VRYLNTAQNQFTTATESMDVEAMSDAYLRCHAPKIYPGLQAITSSANFDGLGRILNLRPLHLRKSRDLLPSVALFC
jgi:hypothetical protein